MGPGTVPGTYSVCSGSTLFLGYKIARSRALVSESPVSQVPRSDSVAWGGTAERDDPLSNRNPVKRK